MPTNPHTPATPTSETPATLDERRMLELQYDGPIPRYALADYRACPLAPPALSHHVATLQVINRALGLDDGISAAKPLPVGRN